VCAGCAADVHLPSAAVHGDHAEILAQSLGAVARATGDGELLGRARQALVALLQRDAKGGGIADAVATEVTSTQVFTVRKLLP
jgi:hypothetical protein